MQTKVSSLELKAGMFVSSLDRPWTDTPFMLQGFVIESDEDIKLLRQYCQFVHIDWSMSPLPPPSEVTKQMAAKAAEPLVVKSSPSEFTRAAAKVLHPSLGNEAADAAQALAAQGALADLPLGQTRTRTPFSAPEAATGAARQPSTADDSEEAGFISELTGKFKSFFKGKASAPKVGGDAKFKRSQATSEDTPAPYVRPEFIPADIPLSTYIDISPVEKETAPATQARKRATEVMKSLVHDIQSNKHLALEKTEEVAQEVVDSMVRNPDAMMWVSRLRSQDEVVYGHGLQVAVYLVALGRHLGLPKEMLERLCTTGLLLDIGKIKLPKTLLLQEERLNPDEFELIKSHVQLGLDILKETPDLHADILQGIAQHHERENGSGYPAGLSKDEISLFGRMAAIADSFAALTNPRTYAETLPAYQALQTLSNFNPDLYQTTMIEQFIQAIGVFPVGSMVELSTGEVAIVIGHSKVRRLKPRVLIISDDSKRPAAQPTSLDLLYQSQEAGISPIHIQRGLPTGAFGLDAREFYLT